MPSAPHFDRLRLKNFDSVEDFEREIVAPCGENANRIANEVIGDYGWNGGGETGSSCDERFRNAGSDGAQSGGTCGSESVERVNDSPNRPEQADEGRDRR